MRGRIGFSLLGALLPLEARQRSVNGRSGTTHAYRPLNARLGTLALLLLALVSPVGAEPGNDNRAPDLGDCQNLQAPEGNKVASRVYAAGVQIYRWNGTSWGFDGPEALLYADAGYQGVVGIHYKGPTWESLSGSMVVGEALWECTADPDSIPWLLIRAKSNSGPGIFDRVTFIQRVNTVGGKRPAFSGSVVGQTERVPYTTEYYFYRAHR
jgi:hypothetical protein